jgi:hypothetical protein
MSKLKEVGVVGELGVGVEAYEYVDVGDEAGAVLDVAVGAADGAMVAPHCGQNAASSEVSLWHCGQLLAIGISLN